MPKKEVTQYSHAYKAMHWFIAVVVIGMLCGSFFLDDLPKSMKGTAFMLHKSTGLLILALMLVRLVWIHIHGKPGLPDSIPAWQRFLSHFVHGALYVFLLAMPLSGWIMSMAADRVPSFYGLFAARLPAIAPDKSLAKLMNQSHKVIAWVLITLVVLHVAAALKHYFINKDNIMQRML